MIRFAVAALAVACTPQIAHAQVQKQSFIAWCFPSIQQLDEAMGDGATLAPVSKPNGMGAVPFLADSDDRQAMGVLLPDGRACVVWDRKRDPEA